MERVSRRLRLLTGAPIACLLVLATLGCSDTGPRPLTDEELARVTVEGRVSKWLPSRFSGTVQNDSTLHLHQLELEIHGKTVLKNLRIAPGESRRVSLQYLFPEDEGFGTVDPQKVEWRLAGATGSTVPP